MFVVDCRCAHHACTGSGQCELCHREAYQLEVVVRSADQGKLSDNVLRQRLLWMFFVLAGALRSLSQRCARIELSSCVK